MRDTPISEIANEICSHNYVINRHVVVSRIQCVLRCKRQESCYSINIVAILPEEHSTNSGDNFYCELTTVKPTETDVNIIPLDTTGEIPRLHSVRDLELESGVALWISPKLRLRLGSSRFGTSISLI